MLNLQHAPCDWSNILLYFYTRETLKSKQRNLKQFRKENNSNTNDGITDEDIDILYEALSFWRKGWWREKQKYSFG